MPAVPVAVPTVPVVAKVVTPAQEAPQVAADPESKAPSSMVPYALIALGAAGICAFVAMRLR